MNLIFLGTSAGSPTKTRNVTSLALQWQRSGKVWLFDCGEGTQQRFQMAPLKLSHVDKIFVTHMHGDHVFGLPGLLASRSSAQSIATALEIYGPPQLEEYLKFVLAITHTRIKFEWTFRPIQEGIVLDDDQSIVTCRLLNHGIPSYGYSIVERPVSGEFNPALALVRGVPKGPMFGALKRGESVTLDDGTLVEAAGLIDDPKPPRKIVICGDTGVSKAAVELAENADILVHESTFKSDMTTRAAEVGHSTAVQAAEVALSGRVRHLILTHFSPRYDQSGASILGELLAEARSIFPATSLAEELEVVAVPHRNEQEITVD